MRLKENVVAAGAEEAGLRVLIRQPLRVEVFEGALVEVVLGRRALHHLEYPAQIDLAAVDAGLVQG